MTTLTGLLHTDIPVWTVLLFWVWGVLFCIAVIYSVVFFRNRAITDPKVNESAKVDEPAKLDEPGKVDE